MQFLALIYSERDKADVDMPTMLNEYKAFGAEASAAGVLLSGNALQPIATATSVQMRNAQATFIDGPFAETKEQLGGYYLMDCKDIDEALQWAAKIPTARYGTIEVRPVMTFD